MKKINNSIIILLMIGFSTVFISCIQGPTGAKGEPGGAEAGEKKAEVSDDTTPDFYGKSANRSATPYPDAEAFADTISLQIHQAYIDKIANYLKDSTIMLNVHQISVGGYGGDYGSILLTGYTLRESQALTIVEEIKGKRFGLDSVRVRASISFSDLDGSGSDHTLLLDTMLYPQGIAVNFSHELISFTTNAYYQKRCFEYVEEWRNSTPEPDSNDVKYISLEQCEANLTWGECRKYEVDCI